MNCPKKQKNQNGSSMIEMMVALTVLAIGMMGSLSMQVTSTRFNQGAHFYSQAVFLANDIVDSIRTNPSVSNAYIIMLNDPAPASRDCENTDITCNALDLRDWNIARWRENVENSLPNAKSSIEQSGDFIVVTIQFSGSSMQLEVVEGEDSPVEEYVLVTEI